MKKSILALVVIFSIALFLRVWQLERIPVSLTDDEVRLVYNAYSIWKTGKDVNGTFLPLAFLNNGYAFNPVPIYLASPIVGVFGLNIFNARILFAITGALTVLLVYAITRKLLKSDSIAFLSALALAFSPWHIHISRIAYEGELALFFFTAGIYLFLLIKKHRFTTLAVSLFLFVLGFYSYSGYKLIFLPVIAVLVIYKMKELGRRQILVVAFTVLATFAIFGYLAKYQGAGSYGAGQFFFQDKQATALAVELERRASPAPELLRKLYHNKFTYWSRIFMERYQYALSAQYLFINQEGSGIFSMWFRGQYYYHEAILIALGLFYLFLKHRKEFFLLIALILTAPIPSGLGPDPVTYSIRSSLLLPGLATCIGTGVYAIAYFTKRMFWRYGLYALIIVAYVYLIGGYLTQYYYEWMVYGAKYYSKGTRDAVDIINKERGNADTLVIDGFSVTELLHYAFYTKLSPSLVQELYRGEGSIVFDSLIFHQSCMKSESGSLKEKNITYVIPLHCIQEKGAKFYSPGPTTASYIIKSSEGHDEWFVFKN